MIDGVSHLSIVMLIIFLFVANLAFLGLIYERMRQSHYLTMVHLSRIETVLGIGVEDDDDRE